MTDTTARGADPVERAHTLARAGHAGGSDWRGRSRKQTVVRLLSGEELALMISRELGVRAAEPSAWQCAFLPRVDAALRTPRPIPLPRLEAEVGELTTAVVRGRAWLEQPGLLDPA